MRHSALTNIASTVSADVESSLEDFIARANSTLQEFGGWNSEADQAAQLAAQQRAAEEAALRDMESVNAQVVNELKALESKTSNELREAVLRAERAEATAQELETRLAGAQSVEYAELEAQLAEAEARAKNAEAKAKKAALSAAATAIDSPESHPERERKLPLGLIIGAFAGGLVIMFGISQIIGGDKKNDSNAAVVQPDPTPVAETIVQPPPAPVVQPPVEPAPAVAEPAPIVAEPDVKPVDSQPVEPDPVVEPVAVAVKKPATRPTTKKPATKKPATKTSGIVDPFATTKPATKKPTTKKKTTKKPTKKSPKKATGGIVDPFAM